MTWAKLDDHFDENPKVAGLSDYAFRAYVEGICYSARNLTDGRLPAPIVSRRWYDSLTELQEAGLWQNTREAIVVHDFLDYNPSRADTFAKRDSARVRMNLQRTSQQPAIPRTRTRTQSRPEPEPQELAPTVRARKSDPEFATLAEAFGIDWHHLTPAARGRLNAALAQIRSAGDCSATEILSRAEHLRRSGDFTQTPNALAAHWPALKDGPLQRGNGRRSIEGQVAGINEALDLTFGKEAQDESE